MTFEYRFINLTSYKANLEKELTSKYKIDGLDLEDVFTSTQLSKFEKHGSYQYVALQFPEFSQLDEIFVTKEVHCFISPDFLLVIDKQNFEILSQFQASHPRDGITSQAPTSFEEFYEILDFILTRLYRAMPKFAREVDTLEEDLFTSKGTDRDFILDIQILKRNLINFASLVAPLEDVIEEMQTDYVKRDPEDSRVELLDDCLDKVRKMRNNLRNFRDQATLMSETNEALIARNTNEVIKVMTATSILVIIPSFIAAFFGMNIYLGWDPTVHSYVPAILLIGSMGLVMLLIWMYFKHRKWL